MAWSETAGYMAAKGMFLIPQFLALAILVELVGGFALLVGFKGRWAGALLFCYLVPVTLVFHNFWALTGPEAQVQLVNFLKNMAILGGLLTTAIYGSGAVSVDSRLSNETLSVGLRVVEKKDQLKRVG